MIYSIPYDILIVMLLVLALICHQREEDETLCRRLTAFGVIVFWFFFAFRGLVFTDWYSYYDEFRQTSWNQFTNYSFNLSGVREPLYLFLINMCKSLVGNYYFFIILSTTIIVWLLVRFLKHYSGNVLLALALFMAFSGVEMICNIVRNMIAITIFLNALPYVEEKKPLKYFGLCLLAVCFHFSAALYFPLYFLLRWKLNRWVFLGVFGTCVLIFLLHIPILTTIVGMMGFGGDAADKVDFYASIGGQLGLGLGFVERLLTGGLVFCYYDKLIGRKSSNRMMINMLLCYYICIFMFSDFTEIAKRMAFLFTPACWIIWGELLGCISVENNRRLFGAFVGAYCLVKIITTVNQPVDQYDNILFGSKSYQERVLIYNTTFKEAEY